MNTDQLLRQIRYRLQERKWTGGTKPVFASSSVFVVGNPDDAQLLTGKRTPMAAIQAIGWSPDPEASESPALKNQRIRIRVFVRVPGDSVGQNPILGANPVDEASAPDKSSKGAGIAAVVGQVEEELEFLSGEAGVGVQLSEGSGQQAAPLRGDVGYIAGQDVEFSAYVGITPTYPGADNLTSTGTAPIAFTWLNPPARFDLRRMVLRRGTDAADPAPTSITGGTGVALAADLSEAVSHSPGSGTWNFSLFSVYDPRHAPPGTANTDATDRNVSITIRTRQVVV